jgi:hypothetical protein
MTRTGALRYRTAFHSTQLRGVIANSAYHINHHQHMLWNRIIQRTVKKGTYRIIKWRAMLRVIAPTRNGFFHTGRTSKLSFSDKEFMALNISTVTRIDRLIVVARRDMMLLNISHPISGKSVEH